jgi:MFS family permease
VPLPATAAPASLASTREQRRTLTVVSVSTVLVLATFVTPLATGARTASTLGTGPAGQAWLLSAMSIGLAAALLVAGAVADQVGRRRVFVAGLLLVAAGAGVSAVAGTTVVFLAGRLLEGVGGAAVMASSLALLSTAFEAGAPRSRATAAWGAAVGAGTGLGGLLTVALEPDEGWRATYLLTAVLAAALAAAAGRALPAGSGGVRRRVDVVGPVLLVAAGSCLLAGLVRTRSGGGVAVVVLLVVAALLGAAFVVAESKVAAPLIDLHLFRAPGFLAAVVGASVTGAAVVGAMSFLPTVLQGGLGESLLAVTLLVLVWSAVSTGTALAIRWIPGLDGRLLLAIGLALSAAGLAAFAVLTEDASGLRLLPGMVVLGVGYGAANAALGREAVAHVPADRAAMGSGANNTARYVGAAVGVTLVVLLTVSGTPVGTPEGLTSGWNAAALVAAGIAAAGALAVVIIRPARPGRGNRSRLSLAGLGTAAAPGER